MSNEFQRAADLRDSVVDRFGKIATAPDQDQKFPVGPDSAKRLGYDAAMVDSLPAALTESFCGVGNPFLLGPPTAGQWVLDLGSGAGFDTLMAARRVGPKGNAIGVDMTAEMVEKARGNVQRLGMSNVFFVRGQIEALPLPDASLDLVITNGVLNLCPDKPRVLTEVFRILRPGGRLQMADILLESHVTPKEAASKGTWSD